MAAPPLARGNAGTTGVSVFFSSVRQELYKQENSSRTSVPAIFPVLRTVKDTA